MSATRSRPPTITDIARQAGVSTATVSYVLNDTPGTRIPEATRRKVTDAADELGYVPHASARSLRTGRSDLVVYAMPAVTLGPLAARFLAGFADELQNRGFTLVLHGDGASRGVRAARRWARLRPAAVIAEGHRITDAAKDLMRRSGTVLVATGGVPDPDLPTLVMDHRAMGATAGRHLGARGCRDVVAVVPTEPALRDIGEARAQGVEDGLREAAGSREDGGGRGDAGGRKGSGSREAARDREDDGSREAAGTRRDGEGRDDGGDGPNGAGTGAATVRLTPMEETPEDAGRIVREWVRDGLPDGVFGYNDEHAGLLLSALTDAGVDVPGRVRLVGADDLPLCGMLRPRLSSVALRAEYAPAEAADRLVSLIAGAEGAKEPLRLWTPELHVRESS
ncbi:LacI family DNA-binding transcriptional regulator [Nocardiopsis sp. RSe5-2]|uniref:LacI family DNA-binding transcriptional regulator n=1 Tax=Nocardiopsis endophytica TaxID=3018445 RepID=A0ABT4TXJ6_9ACTN|nr:LacI family DNA-binding transcriptional regulator [Nocardiopsis endophytica]MDA2809417.1 LacI family DNA-binding transcriptional regulator [Nocardiopsis endophytica]